METRVINPIQIQMNEKINMKQALIDALIQSEINRGRTNISKQTIANFGLFANKLIHPKP